MKNLKYYQLVLGCQMNKSDAERLASLLESFGFQKTNNAKEANLICVQACSVRQSAVDRIIGHVGKWKKWQKERSKNNPLITLLTGCILSFDKKNFKKHFDLIIRTHQLTKKLPEKLSQVLSNQNFQLVNNQTCAFFGLEPKYSSNFQAFVPIQTGCNNFCTYCAVPYTKGREKQRLVADIIKEVKNLVDKGYKEITLLGQNVNTYQSQIQNASTESFQGKGQKSGVKSKQNINFARLLQIINNIDGKFWLRFVTSNPWDMSQETIKIVANGKKLCEYIHLPLQSGSDRILRLMNRNYTQKQYLKLIDQIRAQIPQVAITTDIIVGFPGESQSDFLETAKVMKKVGFDLAYIARYSPRPGTYAQKYFKDDVSDQEKKQREKKLEQIVSFSGLKNNQKYLGKIVDVLVEKLKKKNQALGKTRTFKTVKFKTDQDLTGQFVKVKITKAQDFGLTGQIMTA